MKAQEEYLDFACSFLKEHKINLSQLSKTLESLFGDILENGSRESVELIIDYVKKNNELYKISLKVADDRIKNGLSLPKPFGIFYVDARSAKKKEGKLAPRRGKSLENYYRGDLLTRLTLELVKKYRLTIYENEERSKKKGPSALRIAISAFKKVFNQRIDYRVAKSDFVQFRKNIEDQGPAWFKGIIKDLPEIKPYLKPII